MVLIKSGAIIERRDRIGVTSVYEEVEVEFSSELGGYGLKVG